MAIRTMALSLLLVALPALSAIRGDQPLAPPTIGAAAGNQEFVRVASDGTNFFVVWRTRIRRQLSDEERASDTIIIGCGRLSPSGELLDQPSILLASGPDATLGKPDVVFVGGIFLVAYPSGNSVVTRRFFRNGEAVDPRPVVISNCAMPVGLTTNGRTVFLMTAADRFRLLAADGAPIGQERVIRNAGFDSFTATSNGHDYLVAYGKAAGSNAGAFVVLSGSGDFVASQQIPASQRIIAASNGSSFLIVMSNGTISCISVDANGNAGLPHTVPQAVTFAPASVTSRGSEYMLFWQAFEANPGTILGICGARADADGVPMDNTRVVVAPPVRTPGGDLRPPQVFASASTGRDTIVITANSGYYDTDDRQTEAVIFSSLEQIDAEPVNRRHVALASAAAEQANGSIASNGAVSLVAWRERSGLNQASIRAALINVDGQLGPPIDIGQADPRSPTATGWNGRDFLIAYIDPRSILTARRVTLEGIAATKPITVGLLPYDTPVVRYTMAIGASGPDYLVMIAGYNFMALAVVPDTEHAFLREACDSARPQSASETPAIHCSAHECVITSRTTYFPSLGETSPYATDSICFVDGYGRQLSNREIAYSSTPAVSMAPSDGKALVLYSSEKLMLAGRTTSEGGNVLYPPPFDGGVPVMTSKTAFPLQPVAAFHEGFYFVEPDTATTGRLYWTRIASEPKPHVDTLIDLHESVTLPVTLTASARNTYIVYSRGEADEKLVAPRLFLRTLAAPDPRGRAVR